MLNAVVSRKLVQFVSLKFSAANVKYVKYVKCLGENQGPKKAIFWGPTFNIFNISLVLSTFRQKHLTFPQFREPKVTKLGKC